MKYFSSSDNIQSLIESAMDKLKGVIDSSTVIGDKVETSDGTTIIPVSKAPFLQRWALFGQILKPSEEA